MNLQTDQWCERLYEEKAAELILYGRALGLSHAESEDVLQETFLALLKKQSPPEKPAEYCLRAFRNKAFNYRRGLWRRWLREGHSSCWFEQTPDISEEEKKAMACLARLPEPQREVIVLKIWHDLTFEAIGELAGISPNTAAGRYRYGLQKLQTSLKGMNYEYLETVRDPIAFLEAASSLLKP